MTVTLQLGHNRLISRQRHILARRLTHELTRENWRQHPHRQLALISQVCKRLVLDKTIVKEYPHEHYVVRRLIIRHLGEPMTNAARQWTQFYTENTGIMYPAEAVIRIFKGSYPKLKMPKPKAGQSILDVGCGDGRHFPLFQSLGMMPAGSEITSEIVAAIDGRLSGEIDIRIGTCAKLPWPDASFDYLLSWNSCYYMNEGVPFEAHVAEMARVLKPGGWIVCSVPKTNCFIFKDAEFLGMGEVRVRDDYFGLRNGELMRWFPEPVHLENAFGSHFTNFCHASIDIDMFGLAYNWHVFTAERR